MYIRIKYKFIIKGENFMIKDVKLNYDGKDSKSPSLSKILSALIDYCKKCVASAKGDEFEEIFLNFIRTAEILKVLIMYQKKWKKFRLIPGISGKEREKIVYALMYGKGGGNDPININTLYQAPSKTPLFINDLEKDKNDENKFKKRCEEFARGNKFYAEKIEQIYNDDNRKEIFLKRAKSFPGELNKSGVFDSFLGIVRDLGKLEKKK